MKKLKTAQVSEQTVSQDLATVWLKRFQIGDQTPSALPKNILNSISWMPKSSHGKYKEMPHNQAGRERGASIMEKTDCPVPGLARGYGFSRQAGPVSQKRIGQREVDQSAVPVYADVHFVAKPFVFLLYHPRCL